uniref:Uncharacterized protein n=1 Tax=Rhizophora mucronata TaxID=61149 RepID=A0A2P2LVR3_RHIMU
MFFSFHPNPRNQNFCNCLLPHSSGLGSSSCWASR